MPRPLYSTQHMEDGVDSHKGRVKAGHGHIINSGNQTSNNTNSQNNKQDSNKHKVCDDEENNHRHTPYVMNKPGIVSEKWTRSQARKTSDSQSKV